MIYTVYFVAVIIGLSNGALPGPYANGVKTSFATVDFNENNNCEWEFSTPITDTSVFPFGNFVALDSVLFDDAATCGECYELDCVDKIDSWGGCSCIPDAKVTVMVMDFGHDIWGMDNVFDSPPSVANQILTPHNCINDRSKYEIRYRQVCCDHRSNVAVFNYEGTDEHWLSFIVAQVRGYGRISNFYMREPGRTNWYECNRATNGNNANWVCDPWTEDYQNYKAEGEADGLGPFTDEPAYQLPIDIKITDSNGETIVASDLITNFTPLHEFDFGTNFNSEGCPAVSTTCPTVSGCAFSTQDCCDASSACEWSDEDRCEGEGGRGDTSCCNEVASPTTASPTTASPTTGSPTTTSPTAASPTTTSPTTTTPEDECPEALIDQKCGSDVDCPYECMRCCAGRFVCEYRPRYKPAAKSMGGGFLDEHVHDPNYNGMSGVDDEPSYFSYNVILLIGGIAFILINNIFIGCWCLKKNKGNGNVEKYEKYEQCDIVTIDDE